MRIPISLRACQVLAYVIGIALPIGETVRRWGHWGYPPEWLDDFAIGLFLLVAATLFGRNPARGQVWLAGAWGFAAAMGFVSFFGHLRVTHEPDPGNIPQVTLTVIIGAGWMVVLGALAATLLSRVRE